MCCFRGRLEGVGKGGLPGGGMGWGLGDGCMESVQFVSQLHGRCSVKLVLGTGV